MNRSSLRVTLQFSRAMLIASCLVWPIIGAADEKEPTSNPVAPREQPQRKAGPPEAPAVAGQAIVRWRLVAPLPREGGRRLEQVEDELRKQPGLGEAEGIQTNVLITFEALTADRPQEAVVLLSARDKVSGRPLRVEDLLARLARLPNVEKAVPNYIVHVGPAKPYYRESLPRRSVRPRDEAARPAEEVQSVASSADRVAQALGMPAPTRRRTHWVNPTAPNPETQFLAGDFTDSDKDGMTDAAERRYGYDPMDPNDFPQEPTPVQPASETVAESKLAATYVPDGWGIRVRWNSPDPACSYYTGCNHNGTSFWADNVDGQAAVVYARHNLSGKEKLDCSIAEFNAQGNFVRWVDAFPLDLSGIEASRVGDANNRISYSFSANFPADAEAAYRAFLRRVFPILCRQLGPPAESFNCEIRYMGANSDYFMTAEDGRVLLTDASFYPRLIVHELVHVWKGAFTITSDAKWEYDPMLSGFEEGVAEGMAFEIIHEYVRSYPNDCATLVLLRDRPYQYWSNWSTAMDLVQYDRMTGAGDFWTSNGPHRVRYSISATAAQILAKENPGFYQQFMRRYYAHINADPAWRPNRSDVVALWQEVVPTVNRTATARWLDATPVFNGRKLDRGMYVLSIRRAYGLVGDQQCVCSYVPDNGLTYWGILKSEVEAANLPSWVKYDPGDDAYVYVDMQDQPFTVDVQDARGGSVAVVHGRTAYDRRPDGTASGLGWQTIEDLEMQRFEPGLYSEVVSFDNFVGHDPQARETFRFIGQRGIAQDPWNECMILVGVDGVVDGTATIAIGGIDSTASVSNGLAVFRSDAWRFDMEGRFPITIRDNTGKVHTYQRTLLEAGTSHSYFQHQFLIRDRDFNGIEDSFDAGGTGNPPIAARAIPDQAASPGQQFRFTVPGDVFRDSDADGRLLLEATRSDGSPLPGWLRFDAATRTLSGAPGQADAGGLRLKVTATNKAGLKAAREFALDVAERATARLTLVAAPKGDLEPITITVPRGEPVDVAAALVAGFQFRGWNASENVHVADSTAVATTVDLQGDGIARADYVTAPVGFTDSTSH